MFRILSLIVFVLVPLTAYSGGRDSDLNEVYRIITEYSGNDYLDVKQVASVFQFGTATTEIQRDKFKKDIIGKPVKWRLPVYEIKKSGNKYQIICSAGQFNTSFSILVTPIDDADQQRLLQLHTGSYVMIIGKLNDIFLRQIVVDPAVIVSDGFFERLASKLGKPAYNLDNLLNHLYDFYVKNCYKDGPGCQGVDESYSADYMRTYYELEEKGVDMGKFDKTCRDSCKKNVLYQREVFVGLTK